MEFGRGRDLEPAEKLRDLARDLRGLPHAGATALVRDDLNCIELGQDVAPRVTASPLGHALEQ